MRVTLLLLMLLVFCVLSLPSAAAQNRSVALTFDDLPLADAGSSGMPPAERIREARAVNQAILAALRRHHAPAIGFVNESKVIADDAVQQSRETLRLWTRDGQNLGNHTFSHADLSQVTAEAFEKEILDGEASIKLVTGEVGTSVRFLRYPFNHTGETAEKHTAIADFLKQHHYQVATCTIDNSDYLFARAYRVMLARHDARSARKLRQEYLAFTGLMIAYYTKLHQQVFGREFPHVMLLHANRLNADTVEDILKIFERMGYRFVKLEKAQADPAYRTPDTFVSAHGPMWGYRWARELNVKVDGSQEPEPPAWITKYGLPESPELPK